jgi:uncharacterized membrane protein YkgB
MMLTPTRWVTASLIIWMLSKVQRHVDFDAMLLEKAVHVAADGQIAVEGG